MTTNTAQASFLATRRGKLTLALLAAVAFLDFVDASIVNVALPSIRRDLDFSVQGLQWVPSGYLLTSAGFILLGAVLATSGMLLLIYALVKAPTVGWGASRTIGELAGAVALLAAFVVNELRHRNPLAPFSIFRINGLAFADATQLIAFAGFLA